MVCPLLFLVAEIVCGEAQGLAGGYCARVDEIAAQVEIDAVARQQGAGGREIAVLDPRIELGHQYLLGAAVGQTDLLFHQPDNVAGELGHLFPTQGDTGDQLPFLGIGHPGIHQGTELGLVVAVAFQEPSTGELGHLFAQQLLFIEAIPQALLGGGGVGREDAEHVVRTEPTAPVGEAGVGLDQVAGRRVGVGVVEVVVGNAGVEAAGGVGGGQATAEAEKEPEEKWEKWLRWWDQSSLTLWVRYVSGRCIW